MLAVPYRRKLFSRALLAPVAAVVLVLGAIVYTRLHYFEVVFRSRATASGSSTHFAVYGLVPDVLHLHPLFGLGLNNFSVYYELVTGKTNWGPHSFYVALVVETGIVGTALFAAFLYYLFRRLAAARRLGRALDGGARPARGARAPARVGPHRGPRRHDGREHLLPDDELLLLLRVRGARARAAARLPPEPAAGDVAKKPLDDSGGVRQAREDCR